MGELDNLLDTWADFVWVGGHHFNGDSPDKIPVNPTLENAQ